MVEQCLRGKDQSRRTIAALDRARFDKRLLQRVQRLTALPAAPLLAANPLDGRNMPVGDLRRKRNTGIRRGAVDEDQACTARPIFAAMLDTKIAAPSQYGQQRFIRPNVEHQPLVVHG